MAIYKAIKRSISGGKRSSSTGTDVPKGHLAVYVGGDERKRFVIPLPYLSHPLFQAEEEYGFHHAMGAITIPCSEDKFVDLISCLGQS